MKRAVALILLVCLALAIAVAGYAMPGLKKVNGGTEASPAPSARPVATATPAATATAKAIATTVATPTLKPTPRANAVVPPTPFPGTVVDETNSQVAKYRGTWDTILGKMTFAVNGRHVHGEYAFENGIVEADLSLDGRTLAGMWYEEPTMLPPRDSGKCTFTISDDGNVIHGEWWYGDGEYGGVWDGVRISV